MHYFWKNFKTFHILQTCFWNFFLYPDFYFLTLILKSLIDYDSLQAFSCLCLCPFPCYEVFLSFSSLCFDYETCVFADFLFYPSFCDSDQDYHQKMRYVKNYFQIFCVFFLFLALLVYGYPCPFLFLYSCFQIASAPCIFHDFEIFDFYLYQWIWSEISSCA